MRSLVVTNDFPPRQGGIQSFVHQMAVRQPAGSVVVYASDHPGSAAFDAQLPFPVIRHGTGLLVPTPAVRRRAASLMTEFGCDSVWFGAAVPLGLLAAPLRRAGATRIVATTHGHEAGWAMLPAARHLLRRIGAECDVVTYLGEYFERRLRVAMGARAELIQLTPGVDVETFHPHLDVTGVRSRHGLTGRPVIVCVSRLVPRKGQDALIEALPAVRAAVPDARLLLVGDGPYRGDLERLVDARGVRDAVVFTGGVPYEQLPGHFAAGDVFAMPCRTRRGGMDVEGLGIVYLEASASGRPVLAGRSGGAPDAVRDGETGYLVEGTDHADIARRLIELLRDADLRETMGAAGRRWVTEHWRWDVVASQLHELLRV